MFNRQDYQGPEPAFFDPANYKFSKIITSNYKVIEKELFNYLKSHELEGYFNESMVEKKNSWKTISLKTWNVELYENHFFFPETLKIIQSVPGLVSASFNLLESQGRIKPHCGDTNGIFRCHLGLGIPATLPECGFRVKDEWRNWENGELLIFVDANNHEAINLSNKNRFIFLFDVIREDYLQKENLICSTVITSLFLQKWSQSIPVLMKAPLWAQKTCAKLLTPFAHIAINCRNFLYKKKQK